MFAGSSFALALTILIPSTFYAQAGNPLPPRDQNYPLFHGKGKNDKDSKARSIVGTVTDSSGKPLDGAIVELKPAAGGTGRNVTSANGGRFRFDELSKTQDYWLRATHKQASSTRRTISQFDTKQTVTVELRLQNNPSTANPKP
jgi:hypothetical protein